MIGKIIKLLRQGPSPRKFLLKQMPENAVCAEIGSWKGDFSAQILKETKPQKLFLVDPYKYFPEYTQAWFGGRAGGQQAMDVIHDAVAARFAGEIKTGNLQIVRMDSTAAANSFSDSFFDWVYIDGNHTYEFVKADLNNFYGKVKAGGYITGDDYGDSGWWNNGVTKAVDEFVSNNPQTIKLVCVKNGQFILQKIG